MAITYIVGNPGSGKSYLAVYKIYEHFYVDKKKKPKNDASNLEKYDFCYTNINEFKFDRFDNVLEFDLNDIRFHLVNLFNMYKGKSPDSDLIAYCKDNKLFSVLFVIDEIHNFFKEDDEVLIWWLTYHRHLYHDLILVTQDLTLVPNEYKRIAEFFFKAVDSGKRLFSNKFRYIQYSNYRMYNNSIIQGGALNIPFDQEIFNLYHSGNDSKVKSFVQKYILFASILIILAIAAFIYALFSFKPDDEPKISSAKPVVSNPSKAPETQNTNSLFGSSAKSSDHNLSGSYAYEVSCIGDLCSIYSNARYMSFPKSYLMYILFNNSPIYQKSADSFSSTKYFLVFDNDIFKNLLVQGVSNEKDFYGGSDSASVSDPSVRR
jgi:hypothetical protein